MWLTTKRKVKIQTFLNKVHFLQEEFISNIAFGNWTKKEAAKKASLP